MSEDMFSRGDMVDLLKTILDTTDKLCAAQGDERAQVYRAGFAAAVHAVAVAMDAGDSVETANPTVRRMLARFGRLEVYRVG